MRKVKLVRLSRLVVSVGLALVTGGLLGPLSEVHAQTKKPKWSSGWESEKALIRVGDDNRWSIYVWAYPCMAYNLRGDERWVLISHRSANNYHPFGYYYDAGKKKWVQDKTVVSGLKAHCWGEYSAFAHDVTGDGKWTLISSAEAWYGYYWNGSKWVEDSSRVKGLSAVGWRTSHTFIKDLKGDGKWTLLTGTAKATFRAWYWSGKEWVEDLSRVNGLAKVGPQARATAGFNVFGEKKWNLIATTKSSKSFRVFCWNGTRWNEDKTKSAGLKTSLPHLNPTLGYNLRGDGKWVLISGVQQLYAMLGFQYIRVDTSSLPAQKDVASAHHLATTARIKFTHPKTWNHRVKYSTKSDMSNASWSDWVEDMDEIDVKLTHLSPATTYYYEAYTYVPWDTSYYVKSSVTKFTTKASQETVVVKPGESIQDALEMLPLKGGTIQLAKGVHDVHDTIVINRSNITIQGTHESEIRCRLRYKDLFAIPHEAPSMGEPWDTMPVLENITFKGYKVTGRLKWGIIAWNVKNLTIEGILHKAGGALVATNPTGSNTKARSENIFIKNNICSPGSIGFCYAKNVHVTGNTIQATGIMSGIDINNNAHYVYIRNNKITGGTNYNIRAHSGSHIWIENNMLLGHSPMGIMMDGTNNLTIRNNVITNCSQAGINFDFQYGRQKCSVRNNLIYNNPGHGISTTSHGGRSFKKPCDIDIVNNTICNNGRNGIDMGVEWIAFKNLSNNIIAGNKGYGINYVKTLRPTIIKYNNVWNNAKGNYNKTSAGTGDISADPLFVNAAKGDFYLRSKAGRWDPKAKKWVKDAVSSPCIDAGEPKGDCSREPAPNGGRVNVGAYGNTTEASKSTAR